MDNHQSCVITALALNQCLLLYSLKNDLQCISRNAKHNKNPVILKCNTSLAMMRSMVLFYKNCCSLLYSL